MLALLAMFLVVGAVAQAAPHEKPDAFVKRILSYHFRGQYGREWDLLHPGQQKLVSRERMEECFAENSDGLELTAMDTLEVYRDPLRVLGVPQRTSMAVTLRAKGQLPTGEKFSVVWTMHAVDVGRRWAWVLGSSSVRAFRAGRCPP